MTATARWDTPSEREWVAARLRARDWDATLAEIDRARKQEFIAAAHEWYAPDPMGTDAAVPMAWTWADRLIIGAVCLFGGALWGWLIWRTFERLTA